MTPKLTERQQEVMYWVQQGATNKHIAERLNVTEATVKLHTSLIMKKYGVQRRIQLVLAANKNQPINLIPIDIEQDPVMWIQEDAKTITGFSTTAVDGWTPVYKRI
jgi:DNA-binding CsgD family transcriptional regulator